MNKKSIVFSFEEKEIECFLSVGTYLNNNRLYLGLETDSSFFDDITINLPEISLTSDSMVFLNSDLSKDIKKVLLKEGILSSYLYSQQYNYGNYDCYFVDLDKIREYDPDGYIDFERSNNMDGDYNVG